MSGATMWRTVACLLAAEVGAADCAQSPPTTPRATCTPSSGSVLPGQHVGWYVTTQGSSAGNGSSAAPWDLQTALSGGQGRVQPGDTIWLRAGKYCGSFTSSLNGTAALPIVVRQYPGERAIIDGVTAPPADIFQINGSWTEFWDFEVMDSGTDRNNERPTALYVYRGSNIKLIDLVAHDAGMGVYTESDVSNIVIYGLVIYNGGNWAPTRSDGHGLYIKNTGPGPKILRDNVIFNMFGFGVHCYTLASSGQLKNITFTGNVAFNSGVISGYDRPTGNANLNFQIGGDGVADQDSAVDNMTYFSPGHGDANARIGYKTLLNGSVTFQRNYIVGGNLALEWGYWQSAQVGGNVLIGSNDILNFHNPSTSGHQWVGIAYYRDPTAGAWSYNGNAYSLAAWRSATGLGATDAATTGTPSAPQVFVRPNQYEPGRANIVIYNWTGQGSVAVNLSGVLSVGNVYEVRNVQDLWGAPVASGTYGGGSVNVPMSGVTPPQPIGGSPVTPIKTGPAFDVFIVRRTGP